MESAPSLLAPDITVYDVFDCRCGAHSRHWDSIIQNKVD